MKPAAALRILLGLCTLGLFESPAISQSAPDDAAWKQLYQQAVNRQRRLIFNNDGNEPVYLCTNATAAELLRTRTAPLAGSQVDSIFYCTWSSGFGLFTHNTKVGQVFNTREGRFKDNRTQEFLDKGIDPLAVMVAFAHANNIELFWSFRVNDTHDASRADYGPLMFRANKLKQTHPEWLIGSADKKQKYGAWSAVDYGVPEIRTLAFRYCEEVCQNYDVDGIELDFFRHAFLFKRSASGEPCGEPELNQLAGLLRRIRAMTGELGRKRGRPILVAVRVPDSVEYCKVIGIDLERWLRDSLLDLLIVGGYTQLNPWQYSVELGHKYRVKVYPSLDESRVRDEDARALRSTLPAFRGRALNAWAAEADGVYLFNFFDPHSPLWRELGDVASLKTLPRDYFASVRGLGSMPVPHGKFQHAQTLNPAAPISISAGKQSLIEFQIGEDFPAGFSAKATLRLRFKAPPPADAVTIEFNGIGLPHDKPTTDWLELPVPLELIRKGTNRLNLTAKTLSAIPIPLLDLCVSVVPK